MASLPNFDQVAFEIYEAAARENAEVSKKRRFGRTGSRRYLGMSQIGGPCDRALWYDFRSFTPRPFDGRLGLLFGDGDYYEEKIIKYLHLAGYRIEHTGFADQLAFSRFDGLFRGHADGVIHGVTQRPHILECKSANKNKFEAFRKFGVKKTYPVYYCQCQCYMGEADMDRALVVVYCKDNSQIYTERIHFNRHDYEELLLRARSIIYANEIPARAFHSDQEMECRWCNFRLHCWSPEEALIMADDRVCGSCWYQSWKGLKSCCLHPDHPYFIETWGIGCEDYSYVFDKEIGQVHKLNRKPRVSEDEVKKAEES